MKHTFLFAMALALILSGCQEQAPAPPKGAGPQKPANQSQIQQPQTGLALNGADPVEVTKKVVELYNQLLSDSYRSLNMTPLLQVATQEQADKAYIHMAALGEGKARMISKLKKIDFMEVIPLKGGTYRASTKEVWDFAYEDINTGKKNSEVKDFVYFVSYTVENRDGRMVITNVSAISNETDKKPKGTRK